jgi:hypothetical protein
MAQSPTARRQEEAEAEAEAEAEGLCALRGERDTGQGQQTTGAGI